MSPQHDGQTSAVVELAARVLRLEERLASYQQLHEEELEQLSRSLADCRQRLLALLPADSECYLDRVP